MIQRVQFIEAVKHPWRRDMAKSVEAQSSESQGYDGYTGRIEFTETPYGLEMVGYRRRVAQPKHEMEAVLRIRTPWSNVKWSELDLPTAAERPKRAERALGA